MLVEGDRGGEFPDPLPMKTGSCVKHTWVLGREARPSACRQARSHSLSKMRTWAPGENQPLEGPTVRDKEENKRPDASSPRLDSILRTACEVL